jgi:hypothetical protein
MIRCAKFGREFFKTLFPGTAADEKELHPGIPLQKLRRDQEKIVMAFQIEEARDFADHDVIRADSEARAQFPGVLRLKKWVERKTAEDASVLFAAANPCIQILFNHGISHRDKMSRDAARPALDISENRVCERPLPGPKRWPMNAVNDYRDVFQVCCPASENAGFPAVRMHNYARILPKLAPELHQPAHICHWPNRTRQRWDNRQEVWVLVKYVLKRAFTPEGGPAEKVHGQPGISLQAENGGDGILLSPANNEAGDDMGRE